MDLSFTEKKNIRKNFGKLIETLTIPNLIEFDQDSLRQESHQRHWILLTKVEPSCEKDIPSGKLI